MRVVVFATILVAFGCGDDSMLADAGTVGDALSADTGPDTAMDAGADSGNTRASDRFEQHQTLRFVEGSTAPIELDVPDDVVSIGVTVTTDIDLEDTWLAVCEWVAPGETVIVSPDWRNFTDLTVCQRQCATPGCDPRGLCANPVKGETRTASGTVFPSGPAVLPTGGTHRLRICGTALFEQPLDDVEVEVTFEVRTGPLPAAGVLPLNLFFTGARGWNAANAGDAPEFQELMSDVARIYEAVDVSVDVQSLGDLPPPGVIDLFMDRFPILDALPESGDGIDVIFVEELSEEGVLGVSTGVPGPFVRGLGAVIVRVDETTELDTLDTVIAHEIGHYLGLPHTGQEAFGFVLEDPFDDTVTGDERVLMFPGNAGGTYISPQQRDVILRSPHIIAAGEAP